MTHHNQTKKLTSWFLILPLNESIDDKRHRVWSSNPRPYEAQLEDQKVKESLRWSFGRGKSHKTNKKHEKRQTKKKSKEKLKIEKLKTSPNTLNAISSPYIDIIMFLLSTSLLASLWNQLPLTLSMQALPLR
jgi:hypothetical protein